MGLLAPTADDVDCLVAGVAFVAPEEAGGGAEEGNSGASPLLGFTCIESSNGRIIAPKGLQRIAFYFFPRIM